MTNIETLLTTNEVLQVLRISRVSLYRRISDGDVPRPVKMGTRSFWPQSEIVTVIDAAKAKRDLPDMKSAA